MKMFDSGSMVRTGVKPAPAAANVPPPTVIPSAVALCVRAHWPVALCLSERSFALADVHLNSWRPEPSKDTDRMGRNALLHFPPVKLVVGTATTDIERTKSTDVDVKSTGVMHLFKFSFGVLLMLFCSTVLFSNNTCADLPGLYVFEMVLA